MTEKELVIAPSFDGDYEALNTDETIELSRKREVQGKLFRKELIKRDRKFYYPLTHQATTFDSAYIDTLKKNFDDRVCSYVQLPVVDKNNSHTADPFRNIGEVIDIELSDDKVYAIIDVRNEIAAEAIGKTLLGVSATIDPNRYDPRDGKFKGPTLVNACVTNDPVIGDLEDYKEIITASADYSSSSVVLLSTEEPAVEEIEVKQVIPEEAFEIPEVTSVTPEQMAEIRTAIDRMIKEQVEVLKASFETKKPDVQPEEISEADPEEKDMPQTLEELLAELKEVHKIDVKALQDSSDKVTKDLETATALSTDLKGQVEEATTKLTEQEKVLTTLSQQLDSAGIIELSNGDTLTYENVVEAVGQLSKNQLEFSSQLHELREKDAKTEVQKLVDDKFLFPYQFDGFVKMRLEQPEMYEMSVPKNPVITLSNEVGVTPEDTNQELNSNDYIAKLSEPGGALAEFINRGKKK